ncbi:MAG: GNAT family N-acetyltransferase [Nocardioidaceae bacterium]|nr:GNAT family N-acetyltransferase [Nocardioidaceae bacterium]
MAPWTERVEAVHDREVGTAVAVTDDAEVVALASGGRVRVRVPSSVADRAVPRLRRDDALPLDPAWWTEVLGRAPARVVGPTVHAYTAALPDVLLRHEVEQVALWRLTRLHEAVTARERAAGGFASDVEVAFGRFSEPVDPPAWMARATPAARRTEVSAAASLRAWDGAPVDVGVLVHPDHRGRGHAVEVAAAAVDLAVRTAGLARWCADETDAAARAVATHLGFTPWARELRLLP